MMNSRNRWGQKPRWWLHVFKKRVGVLNCFLAKVSKLSFVSRAKFFLDISIAWKLCTIVWSFCPGSLNYFNIQVPGSVALISFNRVSRRNWQHHHKLAYGQCNMMWKDINILKRYISLYQNNVLSRTSQLCHFT